MGKNDSIICVCLYVYDKFEMCQNPNCPFGSKYKSQQNSQMLLISLNACQRKRDLNTT